MHRLPAFVLGLLVTLILLSKAGALATDRVAPKLFPIQVDQRWGYIDRSGRIVVKPQYDGADSFYDGMAAVEVGHKLGFIDDTGRPGHQTPLAGGRGHLLQEGMAPVGIDGKVYFIDKHGRPVFFQAHPRPGWPGFSDGLLLDGRRYFDKSGRVVLAPRYPLLWDFSEGLASVASSQGRCGYINKTGKLVIPLRFDYAGPFTEGLARIEMAGKWGYINSAGAIVIPPQFNSADSFSEGLAAVEMAGKWGYIDRRGKVAIPLQTHLAGPFSEGRAKVYADDQVTYGFIDKCGNMVIKPRFRDRPDDDGMFHGGLAKVSTWTGGPEYTRPWGYIDRTGKWIWRSAKQ